MAIFMKGYLEEELLKLLFIKKLTIIIDNIIMDCFEKYNLINFYF